MKFGVVGYGAIGHHHVRNLMSMPDIAVVGVADASAAARAEIHSLGVEAFSSVDELIDSGVDAVVVAVPTALHDTVAQPLIASGIPLLVEKPLAQASVIAREIIDASQERKVPLMVGYVERYNPAVIALRDLLSRGDLGEMFMISARRVGVMPARIKDANVLIDIGVHDIDIIAFLTNGPLVLDSALGGKAVLADRVDYASLSLRAGKTIATVESNWITPVKIRELYVTGTNGVCHVDYMTQTARFAAGRVFSTESTFEGLVEQYRVGEFVELPVAREEPLHRELRTFIDALRGVSAIPDPAIALESLEIAEMATRIIEREASHSAALR